MEFRGEERARGEIGAEDRERVGEAAFDLVVEQLPGNGFEIPAIAKSGLIEGRWVGGTMALGR